MVYFFIPPIQVKKRHEDSINRFRTSKLHDSLENFRTKCIRYYQKGLLQACGASSESCPMWNSALAINVAPCFRIL